MGYSKMSVTIPDEIYRELKDMAVKKKVKLSHLVTEALVDKTRMEKEKEWTHQINKVFQDQEAAEEHRLMAETIAESTEVEELPW